MGSMVESTRPHAVALPFPTQGHINPLMQFCRALAHKGFVVTFVNTESNQACMQNIQEDGLDIIYETIPDGLPVPIAQFDIFYKDNRVQVFKAIENMEFSFKDLLVEKISKRGPPVSCFISDLFFKWTTDVARDFGVPNVKFWTASVHSLMIDYHIPQLIENGDIPVQDPSSDKLVTCIPGLHPLPAWSIPYVYKANEEAYDPGFTRRNTRTAVIKDASCIVINSVKELEPEALEALQVINEKSILVGPMLLLEEKLSQVQNDRLKTHASPSLWKEDKECVAWLNAHEAESVLYISFGSIANLTKEQVEELAAGLEQLGQPYLWALRPKAVAGMGEPEFEAFRARVRSYGGLLVSWAPQLEVLMHPATGGFLTHCGWNSTLESISAGVPMLCWPLVAEQNMNCKLIVEDWKIGLKFSNVVSRGLVSRDEFVQVVGKLMGEGGSELRNNVKLLKETFHQAVSAGGSSQQNLDKFIATVV